MGSQQLTSKPSETNTDHSFVTMVAFAIILGLLLSVVATHSRIQARQLSNITAWWMESCQEMGDDDLHCAALLLKALETPPSKHLGDKR